MRCVFSSVAGGDAATRFARDGNRALACVHPSRPATPRFPLRGPPGPGAVCVWPMRARHPVSNPEGAGARTMGAMNERRSSFSVRPPSCRQAWSMRSIRRRSTRLLGCLRSTGSRLGARSSAGRASSSPPSTHRSNPVARCGGRARRCVPWYASVRSRTSSSPSTPPPSSSTSSTAFRTPASARARFWPFCGSGRIACASSRATPGWPDHGAGPGRGAVDRRSPPGRGPRCMLGWPRLDRSFAADSVPWTIRARLRTAAEVDGRPPGGRLGAVERARLGPSARAACANGP